MGYAQEKPAAEEGDEVPEATEVPHLSATPLCQQNLQQKKGPKILFERNLNELKNVCQSGKDEFMNAHVVFVPNMCQAFFVVMTRVKMTSHYM